MNTQRKKAGRWRKKERKSFLTFLKKFYFSFYQSHCRGFYSVHKGFVFVAVNPSDVKNSFNSSKGGNAGDSFCMYIAECIFCNNFVYRREFFSLSILLCSFDRFIALCPVFLLEIITDQKQFHMFRNFFIESIF